MAGEYMFDGDDEVTRPTCPCCSGSGKHRKELDSGSTYMVTEATCGFCSGMGTVPYSKVFEWSRTILPE